MPIAIPVKFRYASRDLLFDLGSSEAIEGDHVICETERGLEIGLTTADAREYSDAELHDIIGEAPLKPVLRIASEDDLAYADQLAEEAEKVLPLFRRLAEEEGLDMKPIGVEFTFDDTKAVCYFSADERVDFRQLVRDLSHELHRRIDMRQIGVREEAALVGGYGHCGQELCCARFGHQFEPVSIRMAKEQDLPLNSAKISGACGRLMCCLRYEFEAYRDFKQRAPKRNAVIDTPLGKAKIAEYNTPKEELTLRLENGKSLHVKLADMTASDAAIKKSEELNCACRPDTVTRDILDKLSSPDVQMALAELDREHGVSPDAFDFDDEDLFVVSKNERAHQQKIEQNPKQTSASVVDFAHAEVEPEPKKTAHKAGKLRKRRRHTHEEAEATPDISTRKRSTRRKAEAYKTNAQHRPSEQARVVAKAEKSAQTRADVSTRSGAAPEALRKRRRHHKLEAHTPAISAAPKVKRQRSSVEADTTHHKRRRVGDRGGVQDSQAPQPRVRTRRRRHRGSGDADVTRQ